MIALENSVYGSHASLDIRGDRLDPHEVERLLGTPPNIWNQPGEHTWLAGKQQTNRRQPNAFGSYRKLAKAREPANLDAQLAEIFKTMPAPGAVWDDLTRRFDCRISASLWTRPGGQVFGLLPATMAAIAARGLPFECEIYPLDPDDIKAGRA